MKPKNWRWHMADYGFDIDFEYWGWAAIPHDQVDWYWRKFHIKQALYHLWMSILGYHLVPKITKDGGEK